MSTDPIGNRFRGPTPPPEIDRTVLSAAARKARMLAGEGDSRLPEAGQKSYSEQSTQKQDSREQTGMSDNIVFPCPACGTKYSVGPHHAGKKTKCKKCGAPVTVPSPEVANPTIVGGTRTIRRADIDPGASAREQTSAAPENGPEVDMKGGASVLRKDETVHGAPPVMSGPAQPRPGTAGPARPAPRPGAPGPRPAPGRPMPPGMQPPQKKNNTPLIIGAVGGGVGLILLVVLIVAFTGSPDSTGQTGDGDDDVAAVDREAQLKEQALKELQTKYNNNAALTLDQIRHYYEMAKEKAREDSDFRSNRDQWADLLVRRAESEASPEEMAEVALEMDSLGHVGARSLLKKACDAMANSGKATSSVTTRTADGDLRREQKANPLFKQVAEKLGWKEYQRPPMMDEYSLYDVDGASEYDQYFNFDIEQVYRDIGMFPPELIGTLEEMEQRAKAAYDELKARNDRDEFAFQARRAWIRFKDANARGGKVDRVKNQRPFSPTAMEREDEDFDNIWTYTYWKPFIVFIEKPIGQDDLDDDFVRSLESKAALLRSLSSWFRENLIDEFNLQRQKPQYNAKQAEEEGWPLEVVVLKDSYTFETFVADVNDGRRIPGARAFYSPPNERVMTWDDTENLDEETQWFNESVLIHEAFHMLSDFYAADPMFDTAEMRQRPRYVNILVQEGLTDSVAGFTRQGEGGSATYKFLELNHLRLRSFQGLYKQLGERTIFRIKDMLECRSYGQCAQVAFRRALEMGGLNPNAVVQSATGIFYPTACTCSYFFHHYKEGGKYVYRDKWWDYIRSDYTGETTLASFADSRGINKFKEIFEIRSDADFEELNQKWLDYTLSLDPEDVGKSGGGDVDLDKEGSIGHDESPLPPDALVPTGKKSAHTGRDED